MDKKRSPKYLVIKRQICPECEGSGITIHPAWSLYWKEIDVNTGLRMTEQETALWFREHGEDRIPPEEVECPECGGNGWIEEHVDIREVLREIAWTP